MDNRKLDNWVAEKIFGYEPISLENNGLPMQGWRRNGRWAGMETHKYSSDISAAYAMEEEILGQGKCIKYGTNLFHQILADKQAGLKQIGLKSCTTYGDVSDFELAHATPLQRVLAALKTFGVKTEE